MQHIPIKCPKCSSTKISKNGKDIHGTQRYLCNNKECKGKSFMLEYRYNGCKAGIDEQIIDMTTNASGIRDISRVLKISKQKVQDTLKKQLK